MINVAYSMNKKYEPYFSLSLHSLLRTNKERIHVYVYAERAARIQKKLKHFAKLYPNLSYMVINLADDADDLINDWLKIFPINSRGFGHVSKECFVRLLLPDLLPEVDKIIYLDCDTIIDCDLNEMIMLPGFDKSILASRGHLYSDEQARELEQPWYAISGIMVMDLKKLRSLHSKEIIEKNAISAFSKISIPSADETLLNVLFFNEIAEMPNTYNYCLDRQYGNRSVKTEDVKIWHICGQDKSKMPYLFSKLRRTVD